MHISYIWIWTTFNIPFDFSSSIQFQTDNDDDDRHFHVVGWLKLIIRMNKKFNKNENFKSKNYEHKLGIMINVYNVCMNDSNVKCTFHLVRMRYTISDMMYGMYIKVLNNNKCIHHVGLNRITRELNMLCIPTVRHCFDTLPNSGSSFFLFKHTYIFVNNNNNKSFFYILFHSSM